MDKLPPAASLFQLMAGIVPAAAVHVAATLGIADLLASGERGVEELAAATDTDAASLYRVLRALASIGIFTETRARTFGMTPLGEFLRSDHPSSQRSVAMMVGEECARSFVEVLYSVQTGRPAFEKVFGAPLFGYLSKDQERGRIFDEAMTGIHGPETAPTIAAYDFSGFGTICDVGGGNGSALLEILRAAPKARGIVYDLPDVARRAEERIAASGLADRCAAVGGDFFESAPAADAYILRHIIHDWDDERSVRILSRIREASAPGAKLLVVESVIPPGDEPHPGKWLDLIMLAVPGGRERTAAEYERLLAGAGWRLNRIVPTASPVSVVEGV